MIAQQAGQDEVEVAHEALIRHWPRLRAWLDQDRAALLLREAVREAAQEWERHGQDESYLAHRGRRLAEAEALAHYPRFTLNAQEQAYLDAAIALREREEQEWEEQRQRELAAERERAELAEAARREAEQRVAEQAVAAGKLRRRLMIAVGLGAVALLAVVIATMFGWRDQEREADANHQRAVAEAESARANEQSRISLTQALATQAMAETESAEHERGALLARQAYLVDEANGGWVRERVDAALRAALDVPQFSHILRGHENFITSIAFAPDGRTLASGSKDRTVRLWDLDDPDAVPRVLAGHELRRVRSGWAHPGLGRGRDGAAMGP